jgi:NADH pyrophosphatase NudC (nudix superfamily)
MTNEMNTEKSIQTLCLLRHDGRILLGMKKVRLGAGKYNGFGGKVEPGESIEDATIREMREESGVTVSDLSKFAVLQFVAPERPLIEIHLFQANAYEASQ